MGILYAIEPQSVCNRMLAYTDGMINLREHLKWFHLNILGVAVHVFMRSLTITTLDRSIIKQKSN